MYACVQTVCFLGLETRLVDVEVQIAPGLPALTMVGLPDKAVHESKDRVRSALHSLGLAMPAKRITVNFAPADLQKEGAHYDLPLALGLLIVQGVLSADVLEGFLAMGQLSLDGRITPTPGVLSAALHARGDDRGLICPESCGGEAAWVSDLEILAPATLLSLLNHLKGTQILSDPVPKMAESMKNTGDYSEILGQETPKRALEIAAVGRHNLAMMGPPGAGKSMLAERLPTILPSLTSQEALEVTQVHSVSRQSAFEGLVVQPPFRSPHHSASTAALLGGGMRIEPGEISLAHYGVLFLDEWPEFSRPSLEGLRQPLETGVVHLARAQARVQYPANFQLVAAMNPCPCGYLEDSDRSCRKSPNCGEIYQNKISGPLWDRMDLVVSVYGVSLIHDDKKDTETSAQIKQRVEVARSYRAERLQENSKDQTLQDSDCDDDAKAFLKLHGDRLKLSMRSYQRTLRVARTLADMEFTESIRKHHVAEALSYRRVTG